MKLAGHCNPGEPNGCHKISTGIHHCRSLGVKVLLSIGGATDTYSLSSADEARSNSRPLGDAVLDGVDFDIEQGEPHYVALARRLRELVGNKIILSATPQDQPIRLCLGSISSIINLNVSSMTTISTALRTRGINGHPHFQEYQHQIRRMVIFLRHKWCPT
ncbi:hypothetical protein M8C21_029741 [Ambrosia artemisiifolia]|uniref:chitinase n=1 Tax=Ambrosia artemisiifolia TaxID=4212 RepID=A0AAD5GBG1_AMBAR|nr:hypothetical protein M8C21_029741 [Ambrosia artemisiifolia]